MILALSLLTSVSIFALEAKAQALPPNSISNGAVPYTTANQWQNYSYTFTASTTGPNYIGFAFRQVPAFWTFTNVDVYTTNAANNLMYNGNMASGGQVPNTGLQAPTGWGVWYQTGSPPGAAGSWQNGSNPLGTGGVWYDGAVQSFDGIYQAFEAVAGTTYTITFQLEGDNATSSPEIAVGVYAGPCSAGTTVFNCGPTGFSVLATPTQTAGAVTPGVTPPAGNPTGGPTLVTSVTGTTPVPGSTIDTTTATTVNNGTIQADQTTQTMPQNIQISNVSVVDQNGHQITLSGTISGGGSLTIANTGTGGSVTLTNNNTYTGATTVNSGATLINQGSIASSSGVTNNGTFNNSGTASGVINNGTFTNSGTAGNVTNNGTATNSGTLGNITNSATRAFTNSSTGTTGNINNSGTFTNSGIVGTVVANGGTFINNATGRTGAFTNSGTLTNNGTVASLANTGTASNTGTITGSVINSGTFNNSLTGRAGALTNNTSGTVNNSGTVGAVANSGVFNNLLNAITGLFTNNSTGTVTNRGTLAGLTNSGTATNYGPITGAINNNANGTFTNYSNGSFSSITNNGIATNNGNITNGVVANNGTVVNNGSITGGTITNTGIATNNGTLGDITNTGIFNNLRTVGNLVNNANGTTNIGGGRVVVLSTGSNYAGNSVDTIQPQIESTIAAIRTRMPDAKIVMIMPFQNMSDYYNGSGTTTIPSTAASAVADKFGIPKVVFTSSNDGIHPADYSSVVAQIQSLTGVPSTQWYLVGDSITLALANTAGAATTYAQNSKTPQYILDNFVPLLPGGSTPVVVGNINNSGLINLLGPATLGNVTNSGVFSIAMSGSHAILPSFTQTSNGTLVMDGRQKLNITSAANLDGTLAIVNSPTAFGRYEMITAQSVLGTFNALTIYPDMSPLGAYLRYTDTGVKLYVTPSSVATQQGIDVVKTDSAKMNSLISSRTNGALGSDCPNFGALGGCVTLGYGNTKSGSGDLRSGNMTISTRVGEDFRIGVMLDRSFKNPTIGSVVAKEDPVVGGLIGWNSNGLGITVSGTKGSGQYTITRPLFDGAESGFGTLKTNSWATQIKASYAIPLTDMLTASPYVGLRYTRLNIGAYTEGGNIFPLSLNSYSQITTDLLGGVGISAKITDKLTASVSGGVVQNLKNSAGAISGNSEIYNMTQFSNIMPSQRYTSGSLGAGVSYELLPNQRVGVNVGWQQKSLINANVGSVGITYSIGF